MTLTEIIALVSAIVIIITAITTIWNFTNKLKTSFKSSVTEVIKAELKEHSANQEEKFNIILKAVEERFDIHLKTIEKEIETITKNSKEIDKQTQDHMNLLKAALLEAYKKDVRDIYYILRETGELSDHNKSYIDKIFPLYRSLGGNSDIQAKYAEMCKIYSKRTEEKYDEIFAKTQAKKKSKAKEKALLEVSTEVQ